MPSTWSEADCYAVLRRLRWPAGLCCPRCGQRRVTTHTRHGDSPHCRYLCLSCRRTFTDLAGAPFARTNLPLRSWFLYLRLRASGMSCSEMAKELGVKWDTVAFMERRLSAASAGSWAQQLSEAISRPVRHD